MGGRIEFAPLVLIDTLESYVEVVLEALGYPEALVTDVSTIGDFGFEDDERSAAGDNLGLALVDDDYVYEMARRRGCRARLRWDNRPSGPKRRWRNSSSFDRQTDGDCTGCGAI